MKPLVVHLSLLGVASLSALSIWTRDEEAESAKAVAVEVWGGAADSVELVTYDSNQKKVRLEPRKDGLGRWYVARVESEEAPFAHPPVPGAPTPPASPAKRTAQVFVGVKEADELVQKLARLSAVRAIGKLEPSRLADFGLDKPDGTLKVKIAGKEHVLTIGGQPPGGGERYAKYAATGEVFAIPNDVTQALSFPDSRLMERELHGFDAADVRRITLSRGGKKRELVRVEGKQDAWADAATPTKPDETVVNWMTKLGRIRVTDYVEKPSPLPRPEDLVVRVDYFAGSKNLGFLELFRVGGTDKAGEYLARTEYGRWYAKVLNSAADQVATDTPALIK